MTDFSIARRRMVDTLIKARGVTDQKVLDAMLKVPRHLFVEEALSGQAYGDYSLPIGEKQTISNPYTVAFMTEALSLEGSETVLEIGTGSGYQTAILAQVARRVYSVERIPELARRARRLLDSLGCAMVNIKLTDGTEGWEAQAPFDAIIVTAGAPSIPEKYQQQLAPGGRLVLPVGPHGQQVLHRIIRRGEDLFEVEKLIDCSFVPLVGRHGWNGQEGKS